MALRRVTKANPCPICGKTSWCLVAEDGAFAVCPRTHSHKPMVNPQTGAFSGDRKSTRLNSSHYS